MTNLATNLTTTAASTPDQTALTIDGLTSATPSCTAWPPGWRAG